MMTGSVPYRRSIYWKIEDDGSTRQVLAYTFNGLVRLNDTATIIWGLLDGRHCEEEIVYTLRAQFPLATVARLEEDVEAFLRSAEDRGLILRHWTPLQPYRIIAEELVP